MGVPLGLVGVLLVTLAQFTGGYVIHGAVTNSQEFSVNVLDFFLPGRWAAITTPYIHALMTHINYDSHESAAAYIGLPIMAVVYVQFKRKQRLDRHLLWIAIGACVFMLGYQLIVGYYVLNFPLLPMKLMGAIPMLQNVIPVRIGLIADATLVVLICRYADCLRWHRNDIKKWTLVAIATISWLPVLPSSIHIPAPAYFVHYKSPEHQSRPILLLVPFAQTGSTSISEYWQALAHDQFAMPGGYYESSLSAGTVFGLGPPPTRFTINLFTMTMYGHLQRPYPTIASVHQYLKSHDISAVVLGPTPHEAGLKTILSYWLSQSPVRNQGVWIWQLKGF